ncbi:MAG: transcriptional regulatory protein family protein 1 [Steroidobacteraceae bacterium]|nr:transcriptional regulatory protein family protein 1 [Steroidobacteraceae bacterium]
MVKSVGKSVESLRFRLLGSLELSRGGEVIALPPSRKVRALLGYLVLASRPVTRSQICELLWDVPDDPRGELRWCLSKLRGLVDEKGRKRVIADGSTIRLDLSDCFVDTLAVTQAPEHGIKKLGTEQQKALAGLFGGELLEGLEIARSPMFDAWITAERRRFRGIQAVLLENLARDLPHEQAAPYLDEWLRLSPFDRQAHEILLTSLARSGRVAEGEAHLASATKLFEADGLESAPLRELWRAARAKAAALDQRPAPIESPAGTIELVSASLTEIRRDSLPASTRRASIAVMPFMDLSAEADKRGGAADALAYDVTTRLAKLRSLFVIAQGSTFALRDRAIGPEEAGRMLNVDYVVSGTVRRHQKKMLVSAELVETRTARIVWNEVFDEKLNDALDVLDEIGNRIVASVAHEIEMVERNRAVLKAPSSLDAWEAHHRGLWHMYRFSKADNEHARKYFARAVELDPTFARAYAGLSFAHFQNAFLGWKKPGPEIDRAFDAAGKSLMVDERDPTAHWAMGRALWLRGGIDASVQELERAVDLSPNFASAHYTLAFVHSQSGDPGAAISFTDHARLLSPFDPLLFAFLGARCMALARLGRYDEAAEWGIKAAARPNAHQHISAIAAFALGLADRVDEASAYTAKIRARVPNYRMADFLAAFRCSPEAATLFAQGAKKVGVS